MRIKIKLKSQYFKENWGAPFIIMFMVLLIFAAVALAMKYDKVANDLAVYAYYLLVLGVVLQLISYIKYGKRSDDL
ncbi:MAG: hypothetical protein DSO08_05930 [Candidatus Methanomethylicota archaeon]|uniref:Uncharacterized protein n=1 Tax=Thermoproteota archaeon TaxID=2056631 RepID=A0A523B8U6_9CREN|nr:MAG: hypothetical protein DSO08_05930 [Candidatus Verstraetearchaeota archaeon]